VLLLIIVAIFARKFVIDLINELKVEFVENIPNIARSLKASAMQELSKNARLENNLKEALATDIINSNNPILGAILDQFPTVKKYIVKHPELIGQLLAWLQSSGLDLGPLMKGMQTPQQTQQGVPPAKPHVIRKT